MLRLELRDRVGLMGFYDFWKIIVLLIRGLDYFSILFFRRLLGLNILDQR